MCDELIDPEAWRWMTAAARAQRWLEVLGLLETPPEHAASLPGCTTKDRANYLWAQWGSLPELQRYLASLPTVDQVVEDLSKYPEPIEQLAKLYHLKQALLCTTRIAADADPVPWLADRLSEWLDQLRALAEAD